MLVYCATSCWLFPWSKKGGSEERKDAPPELLLGTKAPEMPASPCLLWLEATRIAPSAPPTAFLPTGLYIGRTEHVPGQSSRDLQGAQDRSGVCHCGRIRRRNSALSQGSLKTKRSHYPALPLAQIRQLWSKKQMSSLITRAFFACGISQVCSASILLQLSLHPSPRDRAQLLGHRGGRTAHRLSPEQHYRSDSSLPKMWMEKAISAWHFWLRGWWREKHEEVNASFFYLNQTAGEEVTLFPSLSLGWQDILLSHIVLNEEPERLPFYCTGIASQLFYAALSVTPKQTNKHTLAPGFWRNLHRSEQSHFATQYGAGEGMAHTLMPRFGSWMTFPSPLPPHEWHKFS